MKKTLFIFSMVLGAATVFAQAPKSAQAVDEAKLQTAPLLHQLAPVSNALPTEAYKGSIFTKATPIYTQTFSRADSVTFGKELNHNIETSGLFVWISDTTSTAFGAVYDGSAAPYTLTYNAMTGSGATSLILRSPSAGGFLLISPLNLFRSDDNKSKSYIFNAWANVTKFPISTVGEQGINVEFYQRTQRFNNDRYFVEYSIDGTTWDSIEVNTLGVEMKSNQQVMGNKKVTLTAKAANQPSLQIRFRYTGAEEIIEGSDQPAGYFWMIDDVNVTPAPEQEMTLVSSTYNLGFYHKIPKYLRTEPLKWEALIRNTGIDTLKGTKAQFFAHDSLIFTSNQVPEIVTAKIDSLKYGFVSGAAAHLPTGDEAPIEYKAYTKFLDESGVPAITSDTFFVTVTSGSRYNNVWARDNGPLVSGARWVTSVSKSLIGTDTAAVNMNSFNLGVGYRFDSSSISTNGSKLYINGIEIVSSTNSTTGTKIDLFMTRFSYNEEHRLGMTRITDSRPHTVVASDIPTVQSGSAALTYPTIQCPFIPLGNVEIVGDTAIYRIKGLEVKPGDFFGAWYNFVEKERNDSWFYVATDQNNVTGRRSFMSTEEGIFLKSAATGFYTVPPQDGLPMIRLLVSTTQLDTVIKDFDSIPNPGSAKDLSAESFKLNNYPNPAKEQTTISYTLVKSGNVVLEVRDVMGRLVQTIALGNKVADSHNYTLNTANLKNGTYFYTLKVNGISDTKKMVIHK